MGTRRGIVAAVTPGEQYLRAFHAARPGVTSAALARGGSYEHLVAAVAGARRVLDLGCGDAHLLTQIPGAIGLDLAPSPHPRIVQGRAQELPFADRAFDAVVCHLAFMLFEELERVVAEVRRVCTGRFAALLGGGPTADGDDAFHRFLALARFEPRAFGDPRASTPSGWRELFGRPPERFDRIAIDLTGAFDDVWRFLGASYQLRDADATCSRLRAAFPRDPVPCRVVCWLATIRC